MAAGGHHGGDGPVAVIALNMGGPADQAGVEPFLRELFADPALIQLPRLLRPFQGLLARRIARRRGPEARANYAKIGGGSPILKITQAQVRGVVGHLRSLGVDAHAFVAMRYTAPRAGDAARAARALGARRVVALSLYPQYSPTTGGSSLEDLRQALVAASLRDVALTEIDGFAGAAFYLEAVADMVREHLATLGEPRPHVLFSAHGLPAAYVERGDPYRDQIETSYRGIVARLPADTAHSLAFQSRVGRMEWLRPYTEDELKNLARSGVRRLLMVPLAFVSDHVETLYEMDLLYGDLARREGITDVHRVPALNEHPGFLRGLARLVAESLGVATERLTAGEAGARSAP